MFDILQKAISDNDVETIGSFFEIINIFINIFIGIGLGLSMVSFAITGIKYIRTRTGDPRALSVSHSSFIYALAGLFLTLAAVAIKIVIYNYVQADDPIFN